jgi:hypothetical protein
MSLILSAVLGMTYLLKFAAMRYLAWLEHLIVDHLRINGPFARL